MSYSCWEPLDCHFTAPFNKGILSNLIYIFYLFLLHISGAKVSSKMSSVNLVSFIL